MTRALRNDGARAVDRAYAEALGVPKSEMRKITGKKLGKAQESRRRALGDQAQAAFLRGLSSEPADVQLALALCLAFGLRAAEVATAHPVRGGVRVVGKGDKARTVEDGIGAGAFQAAALLSSVTPASPGRMRAACARMAAAYPRLKGLTPHVLRHTFATNAMRRAVDPRRLQAALGHDSFKTTLTYLSTTRLA